MAKFIQIGVTAIRDPLTGDPLNAVPLYVEAADAEGLPEIDLRHLSRTISGDLSEIKKSRQQGQAADGDER